MPNAELSSGVIIRLERTSLELNDANVVGGSPESCSTRKTAS